MDIHNYPIDYEVMVTDEFVRGLLRESLERGATAEGQRTGRRAITTLRTALAEPLIVGATGFLLGWLVSQGG
jgi:hypothetical protein